MKIEINTNSYNQRRYSRPANKRWAVSYMNDWNNPIVLFRGTESQCEQWYEDHIAKCEELDAFCSPVSDPDKVYRFNHPYESALDFDMRACAEY